MAMLETASSRKIETVIMARRKTMQRGRRQCAGRAVKPDDALVTAYTLRQTAA